MAVFDAAIVGSGADSLGHGVDTKSNEATLRIHQCQQETILLPLPKSFRAELTSFGKDATLKPTP